MWTLAIIPMTCWACALVARPRRPRLGNEVEELVYARLLGRQQRLVILALALTILALVGAVVSVPGRVDADLAAARDTQVACAATSATTTATPCARGVRARVMATSPVPTVSGPPAVNQ